jgi:hypothetical protein
VQSLTRPYAVIVGLGVACFWVAYQLKGLS